MKQQSSLLQQSTVKTDQTHWVGDKWLRLMVTSVVRSHRDRLCQCCELHLCFPTANRDIILKRSSSKYRRTQKMVTVLLSILVHSEFSTVQCIKYTNNFVWCLVSIYPVHSIILPAYKTAATLFISCSIMKSILLWCHWFDRRYSGATVPSLAQEGNFSHLTLLTLNKPFWSNEYSSFLETTKLSVAPSKLTWSTSIVSGGGSYFHLLLALYFCAALWISGTHLP